MSLEYILCFDTSYMINMIGCYSVKIMG